MFRHFDTIPECDRQTHGIDIYRASIASYGKKSHSIACIYMAVYLTDNRSVSIRLICHYFRGEALHCFYPRVPKTLVMPLDYYKTLIENHIQQIEW